MLSDVDMAKMSKFQLVIWFIFAFIWTIYSYIPMIIFRHVYWRLLEKEQNYAALEKIAWDNLQELQRLRQKYEPTDKIKFEPLVLYYEG
jgi:uncharacterized protein with PQ loop repeat